MGVCLWIGRYRVHVRVGPETVLLILALIVPGSSLPNAPGYRAGAAADDKKR